MLNAPPHRITSRAANARRIVPDPALPARGSAPYSRSPLRVLDADCPVCVVEQHAGCKRVQLHLEAIRVPLAHVEHALARAHATVLLRRQRRVSQSDRVVRDDAPIVRIELALETRVPIRVGDGHLGIAQGRAGRLHDRRSKILVSKCGVGYRGLGLQPSRPPVAARVVAHMAGGPLDVAVLAAFDALEVVAHVLGAPRGVTGEIRKLVPVGVVGAHENQRVVRRASAERARARVQHRRLAVHHDVLGILPLPIIIGVVADEVIPAHALVLGREPVEAGNVVVVRQRVHSGGLRRGSHRRPWIAAGLEQEHTKP